MSDQEQTAIEDPAAIWPPPPIGVPPVISVQYEQSGYMPIRRLSRTITGLLVAYCAAAILTLCGQAFTGILRAAVLNLGAGIAAIFYIVTSIFFLIWVYRINKNARRFGALGLHDSPGWAVGYFFIPILTLYRPLQAMKEVWKASDPNPRTRDGQAWQNIPAPQIFNWWWGWWICLEILDNIRAHTPIDIPALPLVNVVGIIAAVLAILVVKRLTARQEETARTLLLLTP